MGTFRAALGATVSAVLVAGAAVGVAGPAAAVDPPGPSLGSSFTYSKATATPSCTAGAGSVRAVAAWTTHNPTRRYVTLDGHRLRTFGSADASGQDVTTFKNVSKGSHVIEFTAPRGGAAVRRTVYVCVSSLRIASQRTVERGAKVRITGVLTRFGHPVAGVKVTLYARKARTTKYKAIKVLRTDRAGKVSARVRVGIRTAFRLRVTGGGAVNSRTRVVLVAHH
jgi:hypothetical protein